MMRLVQLKDPEQRRRLAVVQDGQLKLLQTLSSVYDLATAAIADERSLVRVASANLSAETLDYNSIYRGTSQWHLLPAFDHPEEPARCLVTGTGLTHKASAENRQAMHAGGKKQTAATDSMRMYRVASASVRNLAPGSR
jgi:hypothetical protein